MINRLSHQMAEKTEAERKKCFSDLLLTPVMHSDATVVRLDGRQHNIYVCASPDASKVLFFSRASKGHQGIQGTPVDFLHDMRVPHTNNLSERLLRSIKGKAKQAGTFRSEQSVSDFGAHRPFSFKSTLEL